MHVPDDRTVIMYNPAIEDKWGNPHPPHVLRRMAGVLTPRKIFRRKLFAE